MYLVQKGTLPANILKMLLPGQMIIHFDVTKSYLLLCMLLMMKSDFLTAPECLYVKLQSRILTESELPC